MVSKNFAAPIGSRSDHFMSKELRKPFLCSRLMASAGHSWISLAKGFTCVTSALAMIDCTAVVFASETVNPAAACNAAIGSKCAQALKEAITLALASLPAGMVFNCEAKSFNCGGDNGERRPY